MISTNICVTEGCCPWSSPITQIRMGALETCVAMVYPRESVMERRILVAITTIVTMPLRAKLELGSIIYVYVLCKFEFEF